MPHVGHAHDRHDHAHGAAGHGHAPASFGRAFLIGTVLNLAFVVLEVAFGLVSHSVALLADAGHNLSDALGLVAAWAAVMLGRRRPTPRFTYGFGSTSILAALFNAVFLLVVTGGLTWEALQRFASPQPVAGKAVILVAACGIALNGFCAWLFASGRKGDLNVRGAFMHMVADALVSLGVVISGLVILLTGWVWVDPAVTLIINAVIVWGTWSLLTGSLSMTMGAVPATVDLERVRAFLLDLPCCRGVHDLHVWSLSTTETALTCHLVTPAGHPGDAVLHDIAHQLQHRFGIGHVTLQPELAEATPEHLAAVHA
jgi:cobalt-zinc-cadmium efflux system protein